MTWLPRVGRGLVAGVSRSGWTAIATLVLFTGITRAPALVHPRPIDDELVYAVVGRVMLEGGKPYRDAIERKPPLLFWVYREIFAATGISNWAALHTAMVIWTLCTMALLYMIGRRLWTPAAGWWAAALYALFVIWGDYRTLALNGELLMNLPVVAAVAIAFASRGALRRWQLALAGLLTGIAFLLKQPAGIVMVPIIWYALSDEPPRRDARGRWFDAGAAVIGFSTVLLAAVALLRREGILSDAFYWTILNHQVPPATWLTMAIRNGLLRMPFFAISTLPLLIGAGVSVHAGWTGHPCWEPRRSEFRALCVLLGATVVAVASNGQFLIHYFLQLLPPLVLLAAPVFAATLQPQSAPGLTFPLQRATLAWWLAVTAAVFFSVDTIGLARHRKPSAAARFVRAHSSPDDRLFVWGQGDQETGMYLDADRRPASRYISIYPLTGLLFGSSHHDVDETARITPDAWMKFDQDVAAHRPRFIIDADAMSDSAYPIDRYPHLKKYLAGYRRIWSAPDGIVYESSTLPGLPAQP